MCVTKGIWLRFLKIALTEIDAWLETRTIEVKEWERLKNEKWEMTFQCNGMWKESRRTCSKLKSPYKRTPTSLYPAVVKSRRHFGVVVAKQIYSDSITTSREQKKWCWWSNSSSTRFIVRCICFLSFLSVFWQTSYTKNNYYNTNNKQIVLKIFLTRVTDSRSEYTHISRAVSQIDFWGYLPTKYCLGSNCSRPLLC